jgi:hypothetical protein
MLAGLHGWEGLTAFEGSNPSLREQSTSRQTCHPVRASGSARMPSELQRLKVAGSSPAGSHREMRRSSKAERGYVSIRIVVPVSEVES